MSKVMLTRPVLIGLYGYPGSGKTHIARNLSTYIQIAHVDTDRIRSELFETPRFDAQESAIVGHLMNYMSEEFLGAGVSVVYDSNTSRLAGRRNLREIARKHKAYFLLVWIQIDSESAYARTQNRDRRTSDDRYAQPQTRQSFEANIRTMQNPRDEDYLVISGKHSFVTQKNAIVNRLYQMGLVSSENVQNQVTMPELVNLVPNPQAGRVDLSRRNISIR